MKKPVVALSLLSEKEFNEFAEGDEIKEYGLAHDLRPILDWGPSILGGVEELFKKENSMDLFTRFNRKRIDDRQIDSLIGISKGLTADGEIDQKEAEFLLGWLIQSRAATNNPVILNLLEKVSAMLGDDALDTEESSELLGILRRISGDPSEIGELAKATSLPIDHPLPEVIFPDRSFLFTGTCVFGTRKQCHAVTESLGGIVSGGVTKKLNFLVIGTYVTDSWAHETFGRKIEKAMEYRGQGVPLAIVTEEHWAASGNIEVSS